MFLVLSPAIIVQLICALFYPDKLIINVPLVLKVRDIIFFAGKTHNGAFQGMFCLSLNCPERSVGPPLSVNSENIEKVLLSLSV
jgi:hypothetical protein